MEPPPFENDRYAPQPESTSEQRRPARKWYRFTLRRFLIGFVVLSCLFAFLRYTHWGYIAGEAMTRMGRGAGLVNPSDSSKIRVTAVRPFSAMNYEWRISIPASEKYLICRSPEPMVGELNFRADAQRLSGDSMVSFIAGNSSDGGQGIITRILPYDGVIPSWDGHSWMATDLDWTSGDLETSGILYGDGEQEFEPGQRIVLIRSVITQPQRVRGEALQPGDGIIIWLEPKSP